jgi:hypothetical protein
VTVGAAAAVETATRDARVAADAAKAERDTAVAYPWLLRGET